MEDNHPVVEEIAHLLDQCSPEELANILAEIEGDAAGIAAGAGAGCGGASPAPPKTAPPNPIRLDGAEVLNLEGDEVTKAPATEEARTFAPVAPAAPPPGSGFRRPAPSVKKPEPAQESGWDGPEAPITAVQLQAILNQHSNMMLSEVRKLVPRELAPAAAPQGGVEMDTLANMLVSRDQEATKLEARLAELQAILVQKEKRSQALGEELDTAVREVRHRKLDLEFQQLKLEERVRGNMELEQQQRMLTQRRDEASLTAQHAAIDVEMLRSSPRALRLQGTLPWTLRKGGQI